MVPSTDADDADAVAAGKVSRFWSGALLLLASIGRSSVR